VLLFENILLIINAAKDVRKSLIVCRKATFLLWWLFMLGVIYYIMDCHREVSF